MTYKDWELWGKRPDEESQYNIKRAQGNLQEMESTKQLVRLVSDVYSPGMRVLDVGCNVGHYLRSLRRNYPDLDYTGVDAYEYYIQQAKSIFGNDSYARFEVRNIFRPLFPQNPFDIVFCCNVLQHLPDFRLPISNLLSSTKKVCFIRTLLADYTSIVKIVKIQQFDDEGNPLDYLYRNTWHVEYFVDFIKKLGWNVELIPDEFDTSAIQNEYRSLKTIHDTRIVDGKQVADNIVHNWVWTKITTL